jgi:hypothetical protein
MRTSEFKLKTETRKLVRDIDAIEQTAKSFGKSFLKTRMEEGDMLRKLKDDVDHGQWLPLLTKLGIHEARACRYMRLAEHRALIESKFDSESDIGLTDALEFIRQHKDKSTVEQNAATIKPIIVDPKAAADKAAADVIREAAERAAADEAAKAPKPAPEPTADEAAKASPAPEPEPEPVEKAAADVIREKDDRIKELEQAAELSAEQIAAERREAYEEV